MAFGRKSDTAALRLPYCSLWRTRSRSATGWCSGHPEQATCWSNKQAYATEVATSAVFMTRFPLSQTAAEYVDALFASAMVTPTAAEREAAIAAFGSGGTAGRVAALRSVADSNSVRQAEFNAAFVLMQYFGYLRQGPGRSRLPVLAGQTQSVQRQLRQRRDGESIHRLQRVQTKVWTVRLRNCTLISSKEK